MYLIIENNWMDIYVIWIGYVDICKILKYTCVNAVQTEMIVFAHFRYREQKSRMKRCGLRRPIYLVEDYGTDLKKFNISKDALLTAIHDTQVLNEK